MMFRGSYSLSEGKKTRIRNIIFEGNEKEGGIKLFRAYRGLPKTPALIKFLSEDGMKTLLQKTENFYLQEQSKHMHVIDDELFFTIEEKNKNIELTDKGYKFLSNLVEESDFFTLPTNLNLDNLGCSCK